MTTQAKFTEDSLVSRLGESLVREAASFGLKGGELARFCNQLGRAPSREELAVCGALWSEHCSYKSSKIHLRRFHTDEPWVWQGPGENAGIVGITPHWGVAFKMESHNHPSYIEPYQGAATGVGGILRDVFCMGAWPVANMNCLRFGEGEWNAALLRNTVKGIADYGNSMGVPTLTGDTSFHPGYSRNILVNAFTAGVIHKDAVFRGVLTEGENGVGVNPVTEGSAPQPSLAARGRDAVSGIPNPDPFPYGTVVEARVRESLFPEGENLLVYFGQATGRDGVHGATMSSAEFSDTGESLKPTVQVGDPFAERRLLEATLHLIREGLVVGLQDMGAAGLTSSSVEMAGRSGCGVAIDLGLVPQRAANMQAFELLLSESQERMLCAVRPDKLASLVEALERFDVETAVIGRVNRTGRFVCVFDDKVCTSVEVGILVDDIPMYDWPVEPREAYVAARPFIDNASVIPIARGAGDKTDGAHARVALGIAATDASAARALASGNVGAFLETHASALETLFRHPSTASRFPLVSHYDSTVQGNSVAGCGNLQDAAAGVARLPRFAQETPNARVGVAIAGGCEERWVELRPYEGAILTTLKVARRIVAVGGTPLGLTDCLNFGSPTNPAVMRQLSDAIDGITAVSKALSLPVVSGNVSLNNQTEGRPIPPTPMLGVVGRVDDVAKVRLTRLPEPAWEACSRYVVLRVNHPELARRATLECGLAWWLLAGRNSDIPTPDLKAERDLWTALERIATEVNAPLCAPVGQGGALVGAFRMAFLNEATLALSPEVLTRPARDVFAEGQAGFLLGVPSYAAAALSEAALGAGLDVFPIGEMLRPAPTDAASSAHDNGSSNLPLRLRAAWRDGLVPFYAHV